MPQDNIDLIAQELLQPQEVELSKRKRRKKRRDMRKVSFGTVLTPEDYEYCYAVTAQEAIEAEGAYITLNPDSVYYEDSNPHNPIRVVGILEGINWDYVDEDDEDANEDHHIIDARWRVKAANGEYVVISNGYRPCDILVVSDYIPERVEYITRRLL